MATRNNKTALFITWCKTHQKQSYSSKKRARKSLKLHSGHLNAYQCSDNPQLWHIGHLAPDVIKGHIDRETYYGRWAS